MTTFTVAPRLISGGIVLVDPDSARTLRVIALQYNPDTLSRTLQPQTASGDSGDRLDALRLKGPPVETIKLEAELDAADQLEFPDQNQTVVQVGLYAQLAALETLVYPDSSVLQLNDTLAQVGTIEIAPVLAPLPLFVWSKNRVVPVRITEFSITEEAFDPMLNPIRARVSLGLRVLSVNDFAIGHRGASVYLAYQRQKEQLARLAPGGSLAALGIRGIL